MRCEGIRARRRRKFRTTTDSRHADPIAPNILGRKFSVAVPNTAWVTDVTYVWTREGWLYLAAILDLCSRRVVGWAVGPNNDRMLALDALERALATRQPVAGLVHHSDRGSIYASADYRDALGKCGAVASMSRKGDCWDNAVAESFFATIKGEMIDHEDFQTRAEAARANADFIDGFYNVQRMHSSIDYMSPIEFELKLPVRRRTSWYSIRPPASRRPQFDGQGISGTAHAFGADDDFVEPQLDRGVERLRGPAQHELVEDRRLPDTAGRLGADATTSHPDDVDTGLRLPVEPVVHLVIPAVELPLGAQPPLFGVTGRSRFCAINRRKGNLAGTDCVASG
jgi:transposase InsO family protein